MRKQLLVSVLSRGFYSTIDRFDELGAMAKLHVIATSGGNFTKGVNSTPFDYLPTYDMFAKDINDFHADDLSSKYR